MVSRVVGKLDALGGHKLSVVTPGSVIRTLGRCVLYGDASGTQDIGYSRSELLLIIEHLYDDDDALYRDKLSFCKVLADGTLAYAWITHDIDEEITCK